MTRIRSSSSSSSQEQQQQQTSHDAAATEKPPKTAPWKEGLAGACAGAFSRTIMAPVERVKLLKQLQSQETSSISSSSIPAWRVAWHVYQKEGLFSFWRGNLPNVMRVSGTAAVNFSCMEYFRSGARRLVLATSSGSTTTDDAQSSLTRRQRWMVSLLSGGLAGFTSTTVLYPLEFSRTRLAMDIGKSSAAASLPSSPSSSSATTASPTTAPARQYRGMWDVLRTIYRTDGITGVYGGYGVAILGSVLYRIVFLGGYDALKTELLIKKQRIDSSVTTPGSRVQGELTWGERFFLAQTISLTAGTVAYPLDSIRRRMMMQVGKPPAERRFKNALDCLIQVWRTEGASGFFLGLGPNMVRSLGGALLLVGYDSLKTLL